MGSHKQGNFILVENNQDIRTSENSKNGYKKKPENQVKVGAWNAAESATQNFERIVNRVAATVEELELDIIGISEANIYPNTIKEGLKIAGYNMEIGRGVEKEEGANARVVMYISTELD